MILGQLNLNYLRVFESVYRTRCMTKAAEELHLTQSGVSQHIKSLEESLKAPLFDRIHRKLMPTKEAQKLYFQTRLSLKHLEEVVSEISKTESQLKGAVRIGMPIEFGNHKILPAIAFLSHKYKELKFHMQMDFASKLETQLLSGDLDFAFVDEFLTNKNLQTIAVEDEILELCVSKRYLDHKKVPLKPNKEFYEDLQYIAYQEGEPVLRRWFSHHLKRKNLRLNVKARVMDVQAVSRLIQLEMGAGILPQHVLDKLISVDGHNLIVFKGNGQPLRNKICLAYLNGRADFIKFKTLSEEIVQFIKNSNSKNLNASLTIKN